MAAINPATIKLAAKAAFSILTDEEARRRALTIAVAPLAALVLLTSATIYIITMPFEWLSNFFGGGSQYDAAQDLRLQHGYDQFINPTDASYIESAGLDFSGVTFTDGATEVVYFNQLDARWKDLPYGKTGTIGASGCGPTSLAIVVASLMGETIPAANGQAAIQISPVQMADWAYSNGYYCEGSGSYHSLIPDGAKHFGLTVEGCTVSEPQRIVDALSAGKLVVAIMGKGTFTSSGHFLVMRGVTAGGKILIADPASKSKSESEWDLSIFLNEARKNAAAGGPFWLVGAEIRPEADGFQNAPARHASGIISGGNLSGNVNGGGNP